MWLKGSSGGSKGAAVAQREEQWCVVVRQGRLDCMGSGQRKLMKATKSLGEPTDSSPLR